MMTEMPDERLLEVKLLLRPDEVACLLSVSKSTVYRLCERGELETVRIRNTIRIKTESLRQFLEVTSD